MLVQRTTYTPAHGDLGLRANRETIEDLDVRSLVGKHRHHEARKRTWQVDSGDRDPTQTCLLYTSDAADE